VKQNKSTLTIPNTVVAATKDPVRFMLMSVAPFKEPIVPHGPFIMNTAEEIQQAFEDLRNGTFVR